MAATIKPSVASQLTVPINSSVMRAEFPCCFSDAACLIQGKEQKEPVSKNEHRRRRSGAPVFGRANGLREQGFDEG